MFSELLNKLNSILNSSFSKIEKTISPFLKLEIGLGLLVIIGSLSYFAFKEEKDITAATVMITALGGGGGSGVILDSKEGESKILTNAHVCEVVKKGGLVSLNDGRRFAIMKYVKSKFHDLCLISVAANLKINTKIATSEPKIFTSAIVSGHPNLLPNVISEGHFSGHKIVNVLTGFRPCEEYEKETNFLCSVYGKMPVIKTFDTVLATAMIMAGSSGSAVYTADLELGGLVFAGTDGMSYAFIVPHEYIVQFIRKEIPFSLNMTNIPNYLQNDSPYNTNTKTSDFLDFKHKCSTEKYNEEFISYCNIIRQDIANGNLIVVGN